MSNLYHSARFLVGAIALCSSSAMAGNNYWNYRYTGTPTTILFAETFWSGNSFYKGGFVTVDFHSSIELAPDTQYFFKEAPFITNVVVNFDYTGGLNPEISSTFSGYSNAALYEWAGLMTGADGIPIAWEIAKAFDPGNPDLGAVVTASYPNAPYNMFGNSFCRADMGCSGIDMFYLDEQHATYGQNYTTIPDFAPWQNGAWKVTLVPEPETYAMMLAGIGLLGVMTRRRKQKLNA